MLQNIFNVTIKQKQVVLYNLLYNLLYTGHLETPPFCRAFFSYFSKYRLRGASSETLLLLVDLNCVVFTMNLELRS